MYLGETKLRIAESALSKAFEKDDDYYVLNISDKEHFESFLFIANFLMRVELGRMLNLQHLERDLNDLFDELLSKLDKSTFIGYMASELDYLFKKMNIDEIDPIETAFAFYNTFAENYAFDVEKYQPLTLTEYDELFEKYLDSLSKE